MSKPKPAPAERERTAHQIRWGDQDWEDIQAVAALLSKRDHEDITPTSVIRRATRIFVQAQLKR